MEITNELLSELEVLAKIRLTDEEKETVKDELSSMLGHMEVLSELDTAGVEPLSHTFAQSCPLREDEAKPSLSRDEILQNTAETDGGFFTVPQAFE